MRLRNLQTLLVSVRGPLIWVLAFAILAYGHSATVVQLLGPAHRHELASHSSSTGVLGQLEGLFRGIRSWRAELQERMLGRAHAHADGVVHTHSHQMSPPDVSDAIGHAHTHATYQRHHHDPQDMSVVALDGVSGSAVTDAGSQAACGGATLPLALAPRWTLPTPDLVLCWPTAPPRSWTDAALRLSERPPRA